MKKEEEDLCTRSKGELIDEEEELDDTRFPFTVVTVKMEDDGEESQLSELHHIKEEENRQTNVPTSSSAQQSQASPEGVRTGWKEIRGKRYLDGAELLRFLLLCLSTGLLKICKSLKFVMNILQA